VKSGPASYSPGRILVILAAIVIILAGMNRAASILNPILFAIVMSLIFYPIYGALKQRRLPTGLALALMIVLIVGSFGFLVYITSTSFTRFAARTAEYAAVLDGRLADLQTWLAPLGVTDSDLAALFSGTTIFRLLEAILSAIVSFLSSSLFIVMLMLFFLAEGAALVTRLRASVAADNAQVAQLTTFGQAVMRQFGLRAIVNLVTALFFTLFLLLLGVDFALLWGILTFFLSYIPYLGIVLAATPAVVLALAEFGLARALFVIAGATIANLGAENILAPTLMSKGLNISPTVVFVSFAFWTWLLGAPGAFLAMPLTLFLLLLCGSFPETHWLARVMHTQPEEQMENPARETI